MQGPRVKLMNAIFNMGRKCNILCRVYVWNVSVVKGNQLCGLGVVGLPQRHIYCCSLIVVESSVD